MGRRIPVSYTHLDVYKRQVVYTPVTLGQLPASMPLFFVEHQTCCTDAINLYEAGVPDTGLLVLRPDVYKRQGQ